jgi:putative ABC transport system permease protein
MNGGERVRDRIGAAPPILSALLGLYPAEFRIRFRGELAGVLDEFWAGAGAVSWIGRVRLSLRLALDLLRGAVAERFGNWGPSGLQGGGLRRTGQPKPAFLDALLLDIRIALRGLRRRPAFSAMVIVTLGAGIGGVTAMWSVVDGVLLRPLPYSQSERLVRIWKHWEKERHWPSSAAEYFAFSKGARTIEAIALIAPTSRTIEGGAFAGREPAALVSANFFDVLGVAPVLGRAFRSGEDRPGTPRTVVLSSELWRSDFGADSGVIGRVIRVNDQPHQIVGVAPPRFRWLERPDGNGWWAGPPARLWVADELDPASELFFYEAIARTRPGVSPAQVASDLGTIVEPELRAHLPVPPRVDPATLMTVAPIYDVVYGPVRDRVILPLAAVLLVLALVCTNVANLLLSRLPARRAELAMRGALGASRSRLVRQLLTESVVLSLLAALVGTLVAYWATRAVASLGPREIPRLEDVSINATALLVSLLLGVVCALAFGLAPAWTGSRAARTLDLGTAGGRVSARNRGRALLLAGEVALALVLLSGAALMGRSFSRLHGIDLGIESINTLTATVSLPSEGYQRDLGPISGGARAVALLPTWDSFLKNLVQRLDADPRVVGSATAVTPPLGGVAWSNTLEPEGWNPAQLAGVSQVVVPRKVVSPEYFTTLGIPLLQGRLLAADDRSGAPLVAVINRALAQRFWRGENPVGKRFARWRAVLDRDSLRGGREWAEVVGVVGDVREVSYTEAPGPIAYFAISQNAARVIGDYEYAGRQFAVVIRAKGDPATMGPALRAVVRTLDPRVPVHDVKTLDSVVDASLRGPRFYAFLFSIFGVFALLLAAAGVTGVLACLVSQRTHEIGIRMALGAAPRAVVALVLRQVAVASVLGLLIGLAMSLGATRLLRSWLYEIAPTDPASLIAAATLLLLSAGVAAFFPARRAASVSPMQALRAE